LAFLSWPSCQGVLVLLVLFCLSHSGCPFLAVLFYSCPIIMAVLYAGYPLLSDLPWLSYTTSPVLAALSWQFRPCCPVQMVLSLQSCFGSLLLPVLFCLSCSVCPFCLSCSRCPFSGHRGPTILFWLFRQRNGQRNR
jgi:hypothetical protein